MREIRFRAWDKINKRMGKVDCFHFLIPDEEATLNQIGGETELEIIHGIDDRTDHLFLKDAELMQFTGLHDSKGREIYEGDIVKFEYDNHPPEICRINWVEDEAKFQPYMLNNFNPWCHGSELAWVAYSKEIIGNIYEDNFDELNK